CRSSFPPRRRSGGRYAGRRRAPPVPPRTRGGRPAPATTPVSASGPPSREGGRTRRRRPAPASPGEARRPTSRAEPLRRACVDVGSPNETVDVEVLAELGVEQTCGRAVVHGRDPVAGKHRRVGEPPGDVPPGRLAEDLLVRRVDRGDERV